jgi:hypothetical protein
MASDFVETVRLQEAIGLAQFADPDHCRTVVKTYLRDLAGKDERRLAWVVERALEAHARVIAEYEVLYVRHKGCDRKELALKGRDTLRQYQEDFRFLWALLVLVRERQFQVAAADLCDYF